MATHVEPTGWWSRNWAWAVGCGCLTLLAVPAACIGLAWYGGSAWVRSFGPYQEAMRRLRSDPRAIELLGQPIETGLSGIDGHVHIDGDDGGNARFELPVRGPRGSGRLHVEATRPAAGQWLLERLELQPDGDAPAIDLLRPAAGPDPAGPDAAAPDAPDLDASLPATAGPAAAQWICSTIASRSTCTAATTRPPTTTGATFQS